MTPAQLRDLNFLGWIFCTALIVVAVHQSEDRVEPRDFVYFYSVGQILNQYTPDHLYRTGLQEQTFERILPMKDGRYGPSPYPPFVAIFFRPFALLSFWNAYRLWMTITMASYLAGLLLVVRRFISGDKWRQSLYCCLGLLYWPFIARTFLNGQLSAIGFLAMACAICLEDAGRPYLSGGVLAICLYKPTLLLLILPMLFITRRDKSLIGLAAGAGFLAIATTALEGIKVWPAYFHMSAEFARAGGIILSEYVDLRAFVMSIGGSAFGVVWVLTAFGCAAGTFLVRMWYRDAPGSRLPVALVWGTTITWTLILNVYVPLYDTILIILSILLTAAGLKALSPRVTMWAIGGVIVSSYITRAVAAATGIQLLTIFLIALGTLQMRLCFKHEHSRRSFLLHPVIARVSGLAPGGRWGDKAV